MPEVVWNVSAEKQYQYGIDRPVLYPFNTTTGLYTGGVAWDGLISVSASPGGAENTDLYANNELYASIRSRETFGGSIEAYRWPDIFDVMNGNAQLLTGVRVGQQLRPKFGLCYRTMIGSDSAGLEAGYLIHIVYGATVSPSESQYTSVNENIEAMTFSWEFTTVPVSVPNFKNASYIVVDSRTVTAPKLTLLENQIYGRAPIVSPNLPLPAALVTLLS